MTTLTATGSRPGTRWKASLVGALLSLAIAFGICAGLVAWGHETFFDTDDNARQRFRQVFPMVQGAGAAVLGFQRVPVTLDRREAPSDAQGSRSPEHITYRIVVSPLGGLLLIGLAIALGGAMTHRLHGRGGDAITSGARMAAVFAVACFTLSFVVPLGRAFSQRDAFSSLPFTVTYRPSHVGALLWPLAWGLVFGSLGAFIAKHGRRWRRELIAAIEARTSIGANALRGTVTGLTTGIVLVLLAGVLTAVVGIAYHQTEAEDVLGSVRNVAGIAEGVVVGLPQATGAGLLASMGIPAHDEFADETGKVTDVATASIFGGERQRRVIRGFGDPAPPVERYDLPVPRYALGALMIAIALTIVTGYTAAAGSGNDLMRAMRSALAAAACLTIVFWILGYLVGGELDFALRQQSDISGVRLTIGPSRLGALVLPPLWTVGGGLLGAFMRARLRGPEEI